MLGETVVGIRSAHLTFGKRREFEDIVVPSYIMDSLGPFAPLNERKTLTSHSLKSIIVLTVEVFGTEMLGLFLCNQSR